MRRSFICFTIGMGQRITIIMPSSREPIVSCTQTNCVQALDEKGKLYKSHMPKVSNTQLIEMYELMVLSRTFDLKSVKLQRTGRIGTYASLLGEEASIAGATLALKPNDPIFPSFREHSAFLARKVPMEQLFAFWAGDERGMGYPKKHAVFPVSIPVGSHPLHAVGSAMAFQYQKSSKVALAFFGDGATSEGDLLEALNFAAVFKAPVVFVCLNNQFAISVPVREQSALKTLAEKSLGFGLEGVHVDGNDILAVYKVTQDAIKKARAGKGPTFIECFTYRRGDHTTSDDARRYRKEAEVKAWMKLDPISRFESFLTKKKILSPKSILSIQSSSEKQVSKAWEAYLKIKPQNKTDFFDYMYKELTPDLQHQKSIVGAQPDE